MSERQPSARNSQVSQENEEPPQNIGMSPTREPLSARVNSPPSSQHGPPAKSVRRRKSFIERCDTSNETPSSHSSIYDALYYSQSTSDDNTVKESGASESLAQKDEEALPTQTILENDGSNESFDDTSQSSTSYMDDVQVEFLYGHGTVLDPIIEQKSNPTLRPVRSADDLSSVSPSTKTLTLNKRDSFYSGPGHKTSFSMDDLDLASIREASLQEATAAEFKKVGKGTKHLIQINEIYAEPNKPVRPPPERPSTPPGMPSWTQTQAAAAYLSNARRQARRTRRQPQPSWLQRFLGAEPSMQQPEPIPHWVTSTLQSPGLQSQRTITHYRAPRSTYMSLQSHPFNRTPTCETDPFPPMATATPSRLSGVSGGSLDTSYWGSQAALNPDVSSREHLRPSSALDNSSTQSRRVSAASQASQQPVPYQAPPDNPARSWAVYNRKAKLAERKRTPCPHRRPKELVSKKSNGSMSSAQYFYPSSLSPSCHFSSMTTSRTFLC